MDTTIKTIFKLKNGEYIIKGKMSKKPMIFLMLSNEWGLKEKIAFEYCSESFKERYYKQVNTIKHLINVDGYCNMGCY